MILIILMWALSIAGLRFLGEAALWLQVSPAAAWSAPTEDSARARPTLRRESTPPTMGLVLV